VLAQSKELVYSMERTLEFKTENIKYRQVYTLVAHDSSVVDCSLRQVHTGSRVRRMRTIAGYVMKEEFKASDFEKGE